ncbi:MAG TPA: multiubiquitin domain-containing protein [Candidatus Moranbacteria bacterium]|nr:multiubiquitin domain-containing protein [Candidatus Moranbacteria bacterium]HRZ34129.1 multiubiquitin domain-containing protein [Candidatus Moranbacteria bacterium]
MENEKKDKKVTIIVNTRPHEWDKKEEISFEEVVTLAFGSFSEDAAIAYTVIYSRGKDENKEGSLVKGESVKVKDEMIFNATQTNKS